MTPSTITQQAAITTANAHIDFAIFSASLSSDEHRSDMVVVYSKIKVKIA
jgi:hypothetical protein